MQRAHTQFVRVCVHVISRSARGRWAGVRARREGGGGGGRGGVTVLGTCQNASEVAPDTAHAGGHSEPGRTCGAAVSGPHAYETASGPCRTSTHRLGRESRGAPRCVRRDIPVATLSTRQVPTATLECRVRPERELGTESRTRSVLLRGGRRWAGPSRRTASLRRAGRGRTRAAARLGEMQHPAGKMQHQARCALQRAACNVHVHRAAR
jgi:hypothetical protein